MLQKEFLHSTAGIKFSNFQDLEFFSHLFIFRGMPQNRHISAKTLWNLMKFFLNALLLLNYDTKMSVLKKNFFWFLKPLLNFYTFFKLARFITFHRSLHCQWLTAQSIRLEIRNIVTERFFNLLSKIKSYTLKKGSRR